MAEGSIYKLYARGIERHELAVRKMLDKEALRASLPAVGDTLMKVPTVFISGVFLCCREPCECVVTFVNREHLWYEVLFKELGIREGYKLPEIKRVNHTYTLI